jgi:DNA polymerase-3 subunit gamma/tau
MLLVRIAYAADLPTPDEAIRALAGGTVIEAASLSAPRSNGGSVSSSFAGIPAPVAAMTTSHSEAPRGGPRAMAAPAFNQAPHPVEAVPAAAQPMILGSFEAVVQLAAEKRDLRLKAALERDMRLVRCEDGQLEIALEPGATQTLVNELSGKLTMWTGRPWVVVLSREAGQPTLHAQMDARGAELKRGVRGDPLVQAVLERFPGAEIVAVRPREVEQPMAEPEFEAIPINPDDEDNDSER